MITDMAKRAMNKGMRVILVKQQGRNGDCQRNPLLTSRWYNNALDRVGAELGVEVVDLFNLWQNYCLTKSAAEVNEMYMTDGLHPNRAGAAKLAELAYAAMDIGAAANDPQILPTTGEPLLQGDLNGDGTIDAIDLTLAKRTVMQTAAYQSCGKGLCCILDRKCRTHQDRCGVLIQRTLDIECHVVFKGKNLIRMTSASAEGGPNLDYLSISKDEIS